MPKKISQKQPTDQHNGTQSATHKWSRKSCIGLIVVLLSAMVTRFLHLDQPNEIAWDEVHFGKHASHYINNHYYFDVSPPLGKLIYAAVGFFFGYDGSFGFADVGISYENTMVPYVQMRAVSALSGALTAAIIYCTLIEMNFAFSVALIGASMIIFDNALTTISRFILLDAPLIFFIAAASYSWVKFRCNSKKPFTLFWWGWLALTGLFLGLSMSVKFVGLFVVAAIGVCTIRDLLEISNVKKTKKLLTVAQHWLARILCLIIIPLCVFIGSYWLHFRFSYLAYGNKGEGFMSNKFIDSLQINTKMNPVFYGSTIKIKNRDRTTYLHSHEHLYPAEYVKGKFSSQGQQVTGFSIPDQNNDWVILPAEKVPSLHAQNDITVLEVVKHHDRVRLKHSATGKYLLTHKIASPLTTSNQEVTALHVENSNIEQYEETIWRIKVVQASMHLLVNISIFEIVHEKTNCSLLTSMTRLPDWGFKQLEISAANISNPSTQWSIESCNPPPGWELEEVVKVTGNEEKDQIGFIEKAAELITRMFEINDQLGDKSEGSTHPLKWPLLDHGQRFWISKKDSGIVYLLGNPLTWWLSFLSLPFFILLLVADTYKNRRGVEIFSKEQKSFLYQKGGYFLICYLFHYLPFFLMGRVLYFHHYLPSYVFNTLIFASLYQVLALRYKILSGYVAASILCALIAGTFLHFSCLCYGSGQSEAHLQSLKWREEWIF